MRLGPARRQHSGRDGLACGLNWIAGVGFAVPITGFDLHLPALLVQLTPTGPDILTGGIVGPEGSVLTIGLLAAATLLLMLWPRGSLNERNHRTD